MTKVFRGFEAKEASERGVFSGWASKYDVVDFHNDVVLKGAYDQTWREQNGEIPILADHDVTKLIGRARMTLKDDGLWIDAKLSLDLQDGRDAYVRLKDLGKTGLSIGYSVRDYRYRSDGARELRDLELFEVSSVLLPALDDARVMSVKGQQRSLATAVGSFINDIRAAREEAQTRDAIDQLTRDIRQTREALKKG